MQPTRGGEIAQRADAIAEGDHRQRRGQGEAEPGGERAGNAAAQHADDDADLAARRSGQELAERHDVGIVLFAEPAPAIDELGAKEPEMGDRAAEARQAEAKEDEEYRPDRVLRTALQVARSVVHNILPASAWDAISNVGPDHRLE